MIEKVRIQAMDLNPYVYEFVKLLELAVLYDRSIAVKECFESLAGKSEYELIEERQNHLLGRSAIFRLLGEGDK